MSAVDNKHLIEILAVNKASGISGKTGKPWEILKAQCIVKGPDNSVQVGELNLPKSLLETTPGKYLAEFELGVNFDLKVIPVITKLHPHGDAANKPAAAASAASKAP
jgi:hypothetical protein